MREQRHDQLDAILGGLGIRIETQLVPHIVEHPAVVLLSCLTDAPIAAFSFTSLEDERRRTDGDQAVRAPNEEVSSIR